MKPGQPLSLFTALAIAITGWALCTPLLAGDAEFEQQIRQVEMLIQQSVASKEIKTNGDNGAKASKQAAQDYLEQAKKAHSEGNIEAARQALNNAKMAIFKSMRRVGGRVKQEKMQDDFKNRYDSVTALLQAHQRVSQEKNAEQSGAEVQQFVQNTMAEARRLSNAGQLPQALQTINKAYFSVRLALTQLRNGDKLVRTLEFKNKEEEYQYELERNKTLQMMVDILLKDKLADARFAMMINIPMKEALRLRELAQEQAKLGDHEQAIETLEKATQQIIRTIRSAGIYIPG